MRALVAAIALVACSTPDPVAPAAAHTVLAQLERDIGKGRSVAIVGGKHGMRAISSDGAREKVLLQDPVNWVLVDSRTNVVWYGAGAEFRAIDLEAPAIAPVVVVSGMPTTGGTRLPNYGVKYDGDDGITLELDPTGLPFSMYLSLAPRFAQFFGENGEVRLDDLVERAARADLPGAVFARTIAQRHDRSPPREVEKIAIPVDDMTGCEAYSACGRGFTIPYSHYARILVGYALITEQPSATQRLYDVATNTLIPGTWFDTLSLSSAAPDGSAFVIDGVVVRYADGTALATTPAGASRGGGFVRGHSF